MDGSEANGSVGFIAIGRYLVAQARNSNPFTMKSNQTEIKVKIKSKSFERPTHPVDSWEVELLNWKKSNSNKNFISEIIASFFWLKWFPFREWFL